MSIKNGPLTAVLFILLSLVFSAEASETSGGRYAEGELLVKYKKHVSKAKISDNIAKMGAKSLKTLPLSGIRHIRLPQDVSVADAITNLSGDPDIEYAEPNYRVKAVAIPNDPDFSKQWGLNNAGQLIKGTYAGIPDADIDAAEAWNIHTGGVVVAVIDTGVDYSHPDLSANIWTNPGEGTVPDGKDNDLNGYVDDIRGWNFTSGDYPLSNPVNDPMDDDCEGHGTHVAGVIGASGNNGEGISGINWNVKIMPVKALAGPDPDCANSGGGFLDDILFAIEYAVKNGAKVINASYTYPTDCSLLEFGPSQSERDTIKAAGDSGALLVAAAGNAGCDNDVYPFYPASHPLPNIVSVSASDANDALAPFSNYGKNSVLVAAPGKDIYSTIRVAGGSYGYLSGTSMAAPFVSGLLALVSSYRPELDPIAAREAVLSSADLTPPVSTSTAGGRINAYSSLTFDLTVSVPFQPTHFLAAPSGKNVSLNWVDNSTIETGYALEKKSGGIYSALAALTPDSTSYTEAAPEGQNCYRLRAQNQNGNSPYSGEECLELVYPPSGLSVTAVSATSISLGWKDNSAIEAGYKVERAISGGQFAVVSTLGSGVTGYTDANLPAGTYFYRVKAVTSVGESDVSNVVSGTTGSMSQPQAPESSNGGGDGGPCFIATAAYGSRLAPEVEALRKFRDEYLATNPAGRLIIGAYYKYSPPIAGWVSRHDNVRAAARILLTPVVFAVKYKSAFLLTTGIVMTAVGIKIAGRRKKKKDAR